MPKMSGKFKSNPTKTNNLIYIMTYFSRGDGVKKFLGGKNFVALRAQFSKNLPQSAYALSIRHATYFYVESPYITSTVP